VALGHFQVLCSVVLFEGGHHLVYVTCRTGHNLSDRSQTGPGMGDRLGFTGEVPAPTGLAACYFANRDRTALVDVRPDGG